ncbi:S-layer family protein [Planktothrix sp. FACHB-1355]|uniref:S-layer family protein n=1 Tax=Aerosakkonema funiforme FACHB-1375 TaxID=2949571 RepID=A0A926VB27_9CYAN|nr:MULTISPECIES: S-layer family protein [Oscillatoriales]MBD2180586.1 S-layer family protein [Aerosakkonema funiforme FACHB-1375]MBD3558880.1 S-layer family protein [Planktothrix sp. FACHB-1355]
MKQGIYRFGLSGSIALYCLTSVCPTWAQIIPDATLPNNSIAIPDGNTSRIEGGTQTGNNLFHSFEQFNVPTGGTAFFNNGLDIQNIFTRVTGSSISNIYGLIKANGTANLFLLNPNGIIFGPNAKLDIGGSFLASTANSFVFKDGTQFSATNPQAPPLLTVNVPIGLQFQGTPGQITVMGRRHNLEINLEEGNREEIIRDARPDGLKVQPGTTLALVGGNVILEGGNLTAIGGRIELWSVVNGQVSVDSSNQKLTINNQQVTNNYGTIQLLNASSLDASGNNGEIQVQSQKLSLQNGSTMFAITEGTEQGGSLTIKASESIDLLDATPTKGGELFRSSFLSQNFAQGNGSNITIETGKLTVEGGQIGTFAFREGNAGNLTIRATELVNVADIFGEKETNFVGGLFSQVKPEATGNGGELSIETRQLNIKGGAAVSTTTSGAGAAGNLTINASEFVQLINSNLNSQSEPGTTGISGNLTILTGNLRVLDGAEISTSTGGAGNAGNLLIRASDSVEIRGNNDSLASGIFAQVTDYEATGNGGNLTIETKRLILQDGGQISATTFGKGQAGNLIVRGIGGGNNPTDSIELSGISFDGEYPSALLATSEKDAGGNGGNLQIYTRNLTLTDGAQVAASTFSTGSGGSVTIDALDSVQLIGTNGEFASGLFARTREYSSGDAGSLTVTAGSLIIRDGAKATVSSFLGSGTAAAGNLTVRSDNIFMDNGIINADTASGDFGNIKLTSNNIQLRRGSSITTNTNSSIGGNITIDTDTIVALENSDITANAARGFGGRVTVNTQGIFGTQYREKGSEITSDITATSELGPEFNGVVEINTPDVDPAQGLVQLPNPEPPRQIARGCPADEGSFIITGSGGLPANPSEALRSNTVLVNWVTLPPRGENRSISANFTIPKYTRIVEAQGWEINAKGEVVLTERPATAVPYNSGESIATCHRFLQNPNLLQMNTD